jgi:phycocyanin-associated rod linker protein
MFRLYRGYANSDCSQLGGGVPRLAGELGQNSASAVVGPSGGSDGWAYQASKKGVTPPKALGGSVAYGKVGTIYRIEVAGMSLPRYPKVRRSSRAFLVPYEQLNNTLQEINRLGGKIASIKPASLS